MGFETLPQPKPDPSPVIEKEGPKRERNTLSKFEKIIVAVVSGAALATTGMGAAERYRIDHPEYIREGVLDLGEEMNKHFGTKLQVESKNGQYVLHIAQSHAMDGDPKEKRTQVVQYQKAAEKLIRELKQRYGINVYFHEGRTVEAAEYFNQRPYQNTLESAMNQYQEDGHEFYLKYKLLAGMEYLEESIRTFDPEKRNTAEDRRNDAEIYFVLKKNEELLQYIVRLPEVQQSLEKQKDCEGALRKTKELLDLAEATPGFTDQVYLIMGATEKLAREGVIIEKPAETEGARANKPKAIFQTFGAARDFHERREDVSNSMAFGHAYTTNETYIPIVYGSSHDFSDSVKRLNAAQQNSANRMGLIRIDLKDVY